MIPRSGTISYIINKYLFNSWYYTSKYYIYIYERVCIPRFLIDIIFRNFVYCLRVISARYLSDVRAITLCTPHTDRSITSSTSRFILRRHRQKPH